MPHLHDARRCIPTNMLGMEMNIIAGVVLGGTAIAGGAGTLTGCMLGTAADRRGGKLHDPHRHSHRVEGCVRRRADRHRHRRFAPCRSRAPNRAGLRRNTEEGGGKMNAIVSKLYRRDRHISRLILMMAAWAGRSWRSRCFDKFYTHYQLPDDGAPTFPEFGLMALGVDAVHDHRRHRPVLRGHCEPDRHHDGDVHEGPGQRGGRGRLAGSFPRRCCCRIALRRCWRARSTACWSPRSRSRRFWLRWASISCSPAFPWLLPTARPSAVFPRRIRN